MLCWRASSLILGGICYKLMLISPFFCMNPYAADHAQVAFPWTADGLHVLQTNIVSFSELFGKGLISFSFPVAVLLALLVLYGGWQFVQEGKGMRYVIATFGMTVGVILPQLFLCAPIVAPRVLLSTVVLFVFFGVLLSRIYLMRQTFASFFLLIFLLSGFNLSYAYGNTLHRQFAYDTMVASQIAHDIGHLDPEATQNNVVKLGPTLHSKEWLLAARIRPIIANLVPAYIGEDSRWENDLQCHVSQREFVHKKASDEDRAFVRTAEPLLRSDAYDIYESEDAFIIQFKQP